MNPDPTPQRIAKPRSLPSSTHYYQAVALCMAQFLSMVVIITLVISLIIDRNESAIIYLGAAIAVAVLTTIVSFIKRRNTLCPLCRSAPLLRSGARLHERAKRIWPLSHTLTTILSILLTQRFRCMHCATDYDLLKQSQRDRMPKSEMRRKKVRRKRQRTSASSLNRGDR